MSNNFDKDKVFNELNIHVEVTTEFRQNSFGIINSYVDVKHTEHRDKIQQAKTEEEKTVLYEEICKLQYQRLLLEIIINNLQKILLPPLISVPFNLQPLNDLKKVWPIPDNQSE